METLEQGTQQRTARKRASHQRTCFRGRALDEVPTFAQLIVTRPGAVRCCALAILSGVGSSRCPAGCRFTKIVDIATQAAPSQSVDSRPGCVQGRRCAVVLLSRLLSARRRPGPASTPDAGIGHYWHGLGLSDAPSARCCQYGVEPVV